MPPKYTFGHHRTTSQDSAESEFNGGTSPPMHPNHCSPLGQGNYGKVLPFKENDLYAVKLESPPYRKGIGGLSYEHLRLKEAYSVLYPEDVPYIHFAEDGNQQRLIMRHYNMPDLLYYYKKRDYALVARGLFLAIHQAIYLYGRIGLLHIDLLFANILVDIDPKTTQILDMRIIDWGLSMRNLKSS